jgi:outer membrane PBP1 activator LpoA protein
MQIVSYLRLFFCGIIVIFLSGCASSHSVPIDDLSRDFSQSPVVSIKDNTQKTVVVLLPLTGDFANSGKMVRDGFLAGTKKSPTGKIIVLDTQTYKAVNSGYKAALAEQPQLVVGPLTKAAVNDLSSEAMLAVPTLALNQSDPNAIAPQNLFQFSLSPQADAADAAKKMAQEGYKKVIIIAPEGEWGQGIAANFSQAWLAQNGEILDSVAYDENSDSTTKMQQLVKDHSDHAIDELKNTALFLVATAKKLPNILPTIKAALPRAPIYSLPIAFDGKNQAQLTHVIFAVSPWMLDAQDPIKLDLQQQYPEASAEDLKLYAFGLDVFVLTQFYLKNGSFADLALPAHSGYLTIDSNGVINRQLTWATVKDGQLVAIFLSQKVGE